VSAPASTLSKLREASAQLEGRSVQDILAWALSTYGTSMALACSFGGPSGMVLLDMALALEPSLPVFYLDTGLLFPETYNLVGEIAARYHITPIAVHSNLSLDDQAVIHGPGLWGREPDRCCDVRKVQPQRAFLAGYQAWITGVRRDQASTRRVTPIVGWDAQGGLAKIAPLAAWTEGQVWSYIRDHDIPYNPMHELGYPSIGCTPCTRPVRAGEDSRAGRWAGFNKIECGLHRPLEASAAS
jgi:phosphoadenosine phosphosulfate reductase